MGGWVGYVREQGLIDFERELAFLVDLAGISHVGGEVLEGVGGWLSYGL